MSRLFPRLLNTYGYGSNDASHGTASLSYGAEPTYRQESRAGTPHAHGHDIERGYRAGAGGVLEMGSRDGDDGRQEFLKGGNGEFKDATVTVESVAESPSSSGSASSPERAARR